jgi:hypothetical protein
MKIYLDIDVDTDVDEDIDKDITYSLPETRFLLMSWARRKSAIGRKVGCRLFKKRL